MYFLDFKEKKSNYNYIICFFIFLESYLSFFTFLLLFWSFVLFTTKILV